jgi:hypothetical protein
LLARVYGWFTEGFDTLKSEGGEGTARRVGVKRRPAAPLVSKKIPIYGYVYDVHSGNLLEVKKASEAGRPH